MKKPFHPEESPRSPCAPRTRHRNLPPELQKNEPQLWTCQHKWHHPRRSRQNERARCRVPQPPAPTRSLAKERRARAARGLNCHKSRRSQNFSTCPSSERTRQQDNKWVHTTINTALQLRCLMGGRISCDRNVDSYPVVVRCGMILFPVPCFLFLFLSLLGQGPDKVRDTVGRQRKNIDLDRVPNCATAQENSSCHGGWKSQSCDLVCSR